MISDSGNRTEFKTGAVRDIQSGKGRCDLLPLSALTEVLQDDFLTVISVVDKQQVEFAILFIINDKSFFPDEETAILELSKHYEEGAKKYGEYNWQKGIPYSRYVDSAVRHYLKHLRGDTDEPHNRACLWNLISLYWTMIHKPEMNDLVKRKKDEEICLNG